MYELNFRNVDRVREGVKTESSNGNRLFKVCNFFPIAKSVLYSYTLQYYMTLLIQIPSCMLTEQTPTMVRFILVYLPTYVILREFEIFLNPKVYRTNERRSSPYLLKPTPVRPVQIFHHHRTSFQNGLKCMYSAVGPITGPAVNHNKPIFFFSVCLFI